MRVFSFALATRIWHYECTPVRGAEVPYLKK
jgi:hypothetical protein